MRFAKKLLRVAPVFLLLFAFLPMTATANQTTAIPFTRTVIVDGETVAFRTFLIDGSHFFMLRDIAYVLNGTDAQFDVAWDEGAGAINLLLGVAYTPIGGEMQLASDAFETATANTTAILIDGSPVDLRAYNIDGNNFIVLRDLGVALDFNVDWDANVLANVVSTGSIELSASDAPEDVEAESDAGTALTNVRRFWLNAPTLVSQSELSALMSTAPTPSQTRATRRHPNRRMTQDEIDEWAQEVQSLGMNYFELGMIHEANRLRLLAGLESLMICPDLMLAARLHVQVQAEQHLRAHGNPYYGGSLSIIPIFRSSGSRGAIGQGSTSRSNNMSRTPLRHLNSDGTTHVDRVPMFPAHGDDPVIAVHGWRRSQSHWGAIFDPFYVRVGVGVVIDEYDDIRFYMMFTGTRMGIQEGIQEGIDIGQRMLRELGIIN